jgi:hypothetical protein
MARQEGFFRRGTRPQKLQNPGDIQYGKFAKAHGAIGSDGRFARFATVEDGYRCMAALLSSPTYLHGKATIKQAVYLWLGYSLADAKKDVLKPNEKGNYPRIYVANVCADSGLTPETVIADHLQTPH